MSKFTAVELVEKEARVEEIITDYCQGSYHLEFDIVDLPEMIQKISKVYTE